MTRTLVLAAVAAIAALLQTTWFAAWSIGGARPDLVLIVLTYLSYQAGIQHGQVSAFAVGMFEDVLGLAPLGFHAVVRLAHGAALGFTRGAVQPHPIFTPMLLVTLAMVVRLLATVLLAAVAGIEGAGGRVFSVVTLTELGLTAAAAPIVFALLRPVARRFEKRGAW